MLRLNVELLRRVQRMIVKDPANFCPVETGYGIEDLAVIAAGLNPDSVDSFTCAKKLLGISAAQAHTLFVGYNWPLRFCRQYSGEPTNRREFRRNARVAVARIDHFIARGI